MITTPFPALLPQRYHITTSLGESRVATVYRADDLRLQRTVLVHILHQTATQAAQQFQRLHQISRAFLSVYDSGPINSRTYVITEDVTGRALADQVPLPPDQALVTVRCVAEAVHAAQTQQTPHPPITGHNVWLMEHGRVVLIDDWHVPLGAQAQIEAPYRAPEQPTTPLSPAAAVYAFGVLLCEALTGTHDRAACAQVSPQLARIIERATAQSPQQRYATPGDLIQALDQFADNLQAHTAHFAPAPPRTTPMPPGWQSPQRANVPPPPQTKVMASPPAPIAVPPDVGSTAQPAGQQQTWRPHLPHVRLPRWRIPRWRPGSWQHRVFKRSLWWAARLALIALLLVGAGYLVDRATTQVRGFDPGAWVSERAPSIDVGGWIDRNTPDLPDVGGWIEQNTPDLPDIGGWFREQTESLRESLPSEIGSQPATYRVTQQINLRSEPSASDDSTLIESLAAGTRLQQIGLPRADTNGQSYQWIRVLVLNDDQLREGWIALLDNRLERE